MWDGQALSCRSIVASMYIVELCVFEHVYCRVSGVSVEGIVACLLRVLCCFLGMSYSEQFPVRLLSLTLYKVMVPPGGQKGNDPAVLYSF